MRGIPSAYLFAFFSITIFIELIVFWGIRATIQKISKKSFCAFVVLYFSFSAILFAFNIYAFSNPEVIRRSSNYKAFNFLILVNILNFIPKSFFSVNTLLSYLIRFFSTPKFQTRFLTISLILSVTIFLIICNGAFYSRYRVSVKEQHLYFEHLPEQLDGFRIVQISDIHLGSYRNNTSFIRDAVNKSNNLHGDLLLFTGDLVNNFESEISGFEPYLKQFSSQYGKYAILGNHDYGDYSEWPDQISKNNNFKQIQNKLEEAGFKLLMNQSVKIQVKDTSLVLIGVENWGRPPFPQYADLDKAMQNIPEKSFKILMSHDPAHWDAIVVPQTDIPLTLAGHTHGGQFGIKLAGIEFSPIFFIQKYWGGLYKAENQYLYVNRGLGTIGFPGRIEMSPEITLLILHRL
jgi:predicted MPP superfamily phosphohydrolase